MSILIILVLGARRRKYACLLVGILTSLVVAEVAAARSESAPTGSSHSSGQLTCLTCHSVIKKALKKKFVHPAVEMGCDACHVNHRQNPPPEAAVGYYLNAPEPDVCLTCHDATDADMVAAHHGQPFGKSKCTRCHDPHSSNFPKLMPAYQHDPYGARMCEACHSSPKGGKVRLVAATVSAVCYQCHVDLQDRLKTKKFTHTLLSADPNACLDCHDPHGSNHKYFLIKSVEALCTSCHAEIAAGKKFPHKPVQVSCVLCHAPHASDFPDHTYAATDALCLECHGENAVKIMQATGPVPLFNGRVTLPARTFTQLKWLRLSADGKTGHPYPGHPVLTSARDGKPGITCLSCHQPHGANGNSRLLVGDVVTPSNLCVRCHK